jgi:hypothetical protein
MYVSVLLNDNRIPADILGGSATYMGTANAYSGWHVDNHFLPSLNYHFGGAPVIW